MLDLLTPSAPAAAILGLNGAIAANSTKICSVSLGLPIFPEFHMEADAYVIDQLTGLLPTCSLKNAVDFDLSKIFASHLKCSHMDLLLGADVYSQIMLTDVKRYPKGSLLAQSTVFGLVLIGRTSQSHPMRSIVS